MNHNTTLPEILTAKDLQTYFHLSRAGAYNLLNRADFPTLHVGKRKMVTREPKTGRRAASSGAPCGKAQDGHQRAAPPVDGQKHRQKYALKR